jgi:hypothetical protein
MFPKVNTRGLITTACRVRLPGLLRRKPNFAAGIGHGEIRRRHRDRRSLSEKGLAGQMSKSTNGAGGAMRSFASSIPIGRHPL